MLSIKRALLMIVVERDAVRAVAKTLKCSTGQAERVLEELEHRGLVEKAAKGKRRETTQKGHQLAYEWHPPRRFTPAIECEPEPDLTNEITESVPCSVWRFTPDQEVAFEEAEVEVGVHLEYETDRLIEINLAQNDEYQGEESGTGTVALSLYVSPAEARRFAVGLHKAIEKADAVAARRATKAGLKVIRRKVPEPELATKAMDRGPSPAASPPARPGGRSPAKGPPPSVPAPRTASTGPAEAEDEQTRVRRRKKMAESLKALREKNRARRTK